MKPNINFIILVLIISSNTYIFSIINIVVILDKITSDTSKPIKIVEAGAKK